MEIDIEPGENGIAAIGCIHFLEQAFFTIMAGHRQRLFAELGEAAVESIGGIIVSPRQFASASWTRRINGDVVKLFVEDRSAMRARQAGGHPLANPLVGELEKIDHIERQTPLRKSIVEGCRLAECSRKAVKDESPAIIEPLPDDPQGQLIRKELSLDGPAFRFGADLTSLRRFLTQDCAG